jgi:hypothetical protein
MSSCEWFPMSRSQIREWLERHPEAMPHELADLAVFPMPFRRVMVNAVSPQVRLVLWRQHLESFLGASSVFAEPQQRMIAWAIQRLPEVLAAPAPNPVMTDFEREISTVFSRQEAAQLFMLIGPPEPPEGMPLPADALQST